MNAHNLVRILTLACFVIAVSRIEFKGIDAKQTAIPLYTTKQPIENKEIPKPNRFKVYGAWIHKVRGKMKERP